MRTWRSTSTRPSNSRMTSAGSRPLSRLDIPRTAVLSRRVSAVRSSSPNDLSLSHALFLNAAEVSVSADPNITDVGAFLNVTGHLIPQIDIGLSALGGLVSTTVFLNLDASANLNLSSNADAYGGNTQGDLQACVDASTGLAVNVGAQASFFDLFDAFTGANLFNKNFPLLQVRHPSRGIPSNPRS